MPECRINAVECRTVAFFRRPMPPEPQGPLRLRGLQVQVVKKHGVIHHSSIISHESLSTIHQERGVSFQPYIRHQSSTIKHTTLNIIRNDLSYSPGIQTYQIAPRAYTIAPRAYKIAHIQNCSPGIQNCSLGIPNCSLGILDRSGHP